MKYMADDGSVFQSEQECLDYEDLENRRGHVREQVNQWLDMLEYASDRAKSRDRTIIMRWLDYDMRQNPARYDVPVPPPVANVAPIKDAG